jgi:hypothetical protein
VRRLQRLIAATALALLAGSSLAATAAATPPPGRAATPNSLGPAAGTVHYAVDEPLCAQPADPNAMRCFAMKRVAVPKGTRGAYKYTTPDTIGLGPAGGYTPDDLAAAYSYNPNINRSGQLVGIVDWFDDPDALSDLNRFDTQYGLKKETASSFRKVDQKGQRSPLPKADHESSGEIALDVESVRAVCHTCRIVLIEANSGTDANLATAENLAVRMGATEISNSFGEAEHKVAASVLAAYNHPGVVITASTGDDGWFAWDKANDQTGMSANAAEFPSTDPDVVAVGGTQLALNNDGTRFDEGVWNENGADDQNGLDAGQRQGAGGGGCSKLYAAKPWQAAYAGYAAAGCRGKRLAADISAIADPNIGFDVLDSYATTPGWQTIGGTSLASPVIAAMWALAGGSGGAAYPSSTLYVNGTHRASSLFDVTAGGNGFCGGDSTLNCGNFVGVNNGFNPNALGGGNVDCSFPRNTSALTFSPALDSECNAVPGYDGPSGLGTPKGLGLFTRTSPSVSISHTALFRLRHSLTFKATAKEPLAGARVTSYAWNWGDGHSTRTTAATTHHTYTRAGAFTVSLTVTDNLRQVVIKKFSVGVGRKPSVHYSGPATLHLGHKGTFTAGGSRSLNTGAHLRKIVWKWGDGHSTTATRARHEYSRTGTYTVSLVITDSSGVTRTVKRHVRVVS